ncbi:MAG TPA: CoA transferase [Candidatus Kryptonia bacterium]|nr:CoA transferase [Candidatus Kryptonia bacterium]
MSGPLAGIRVLDLTRYLAGPYCTMLLGDMGADVVKIESPAGAREFARGPGGSDSYFFLSANRSKRSLTLDIKPEAGRAVLRRLAINADVIVENFRPSVMPALGIGYRDLAALNPRLVYCGISGFGATGPYAERPGFDQIAQGMSGLMSVTGTTDSGPLRVGIAIGDLLAGTFAAWGITLALYQRAQSGAGQEVTTSLLEALVGVLSWSAGIYFETGQTPPPAGNHHPLASPYGVFRARDRAFNIACGNDRQWRELCTALECEALIDDERFRHPVGRVVQRDALTGELNQRLARRDAAEWIAILNARGVPCGPINTIAEACADPQVRARAMMVELPHPTLGTFKTTGVPVKLSETPGTIETPPPRLGADTDAVLRAAGYSAEEIADLRRAQIV